MTELDPAVQAAIERLRDLRCEWDGAVGGPTEDTMIELIGLLPPPTVQVTDEMVAEFYRTLWPNGTSIADPEHYRTEAERLANSRLCPAAWLPEALNEDEPPVVATQTPGTSPSAPYAIADRIAVDGMGFGWRVWDDQTWWSMIPTNPDNSPVPQPITWFVKAELVEELRKAQALWVQTHDTEPCMCAGDVALRAALQALDEWEPT